MRTEKDYSEYIAQGGSEPLDKFLSDDGFYKNSNGGWRWRNLAVPDELHKKIDQRLYETVKEIEQVRTASPFVDKETYED